MELKIGNFHVNKIVFGSETTYADGVLTVNKAEAIAALNPDGQLKNIDLHVAYPGESCSILPIKDVVEPRVRPDGRSTFPGFTGGMALCGSGTLYALKDMSVMAVSNKYSGGRDGFLDMSGPCTDYSHFSHLINLCFTADNVDPEEDGKFFCQIHLFSQGRLSAGGIPRQDRARPDAAGMGGLQQRHPCGGTATGGIGDTDFYHL